MASVVSELQGGEQRPGVVRLGQQDRQWVVQYVPKGGREGPPELCDEVSQMPTGGP